MNRSESLDNTCPVCHDVIEIYAVGPCDHPVCYRCSTRMRVLCEKADCPICRSMMPQVAFVHERSDFKDINLRDCIPNRKNKIFYEDEDIEERYLNLLEFRCRICPNRKSERTFVLLQTHMRREHQLFACDLCLSHLKIFPYERKFYDRKNLATHRRLGDPDDKSYKGHPLCEFCDVRYNDKDELMKHLRKDHYFCHFCDQQGSNAYYNEYPDLRDHFKGSHFLCTEDACGDPQTQFTNAFSSEIDLKAHKAKLHNKNMSKFQSREARQIEVDFQLHPRRQAYGGRGAANEDYEDSRRGGRGGDRYGHRRHQREDPHLLRALQESMETANAVQAAPQVNERVPDPVHDFPTLNGTPAVSVQSAQPKPQKKSPEEDFPTLSMAKSQGSSSQTQSYSKAYSSVMSYQADLNQAVKSSPAQREKSESKPVVLGSVSSKSKDRWSVQAPKVTEENFPSLGSNSNVSSLGFMSDWSKPSPSVSTNESNVSLIPKPFVEDKSKVVKTKTKPLEKNIEDENEFPVLGGSSRENSAFSNSLWSKQKNSKKTNVQPRSQKVDDDSFVLPDSYYKTYEPSEALANPRQEERLAEEKVKREGPTSLNGNKDFPSLPVRESKASVNSDKKKKNNLKEKKIEAKSEKPSEAKSKKRQNGPSSLSAIAKGLVVNEDKSKQAFNDKTNKSTGQVNNHSKPVRSKPPDWFDNPQVEHALEMTTSYTKPVKKNVIVDDDVSSEPPSAIDNSFPSLHTMSTPIQDTRPPPGFSSNPLQSSPPVNVAPPGFSKSLTAPPGFSSVKTASSCVYIQPADFSARNQQLVKDIHGCLITVEDGFQNFKAFSGQYRQGLLDGNEYYLKCQKLIREEDFSEIFPELIALLPDIAKQQELWGVHQTVNSNKPKASQHRDSQSLRKQNNAMSPCPKCDQIVLSKDQQHHNLQHGEQNDFPTLGDVSSKRKGGGRDVKEAGGSVKGAWIKAK